MSLLDSIIEKKKARARATALLDSAALTRHVPRDFPGALQARAPGAVIAEIKRRSPSAGALKPEVDVVALARSYAEAGAACLSVLTDEDHFGGSLADLTAVRQGCELPVLCKDFIVTAVQIHEARAAGADCILLIAAALDDELLATLAQQAQSLGMAVLVEVHSAAELPRALAVPGVLVGINQRNLHDLSMDATRALALRPLVPDGVPVVAESGINTPEQVAALRDAGYTALLIGEALLRAADPGRALGDLLGNQL
jgi:indole-3-glycerol phosphate synthase